MTVALTLLGDVRWRGAPVAGERSQALLAALAAAGGRPVRAERLIDLVWGDELPANAAKSLQVLVSRTRTALGAGAIVRDPPATGSGSTRPRSTASGWPRSCATPLPRWTTTPSAPPRWPATRWRSSTDCAHRARTRPTR